MSDDQQIGPEHESSGPDQSAPRLLPVERDPNFLHAFADQTMVMHLGRDADLAFLANAPGLKSVAGLNDENREMAAVEVTPRLNEMLRVRVAPLTAVTLAMQILREYGRRGALNTPLLVEQLNQWAEQNNTDTFGEAQ